MDTFALEWSSVTLDQVGLSSLERCTLSCSHSHSTSNYVRPIRNSTASRQSVVVVHDTAETVFFLRHRLFIFSSNTHTNSTHSRGIGATHQSIAEIMGQFHNGGCVTALSSRSNQIFADFFFFFKQHTYLGSNPGNSIGHSSLVMALYRRCCLSMTEIAACLNQHMIR